MTEQTQQSTVPATYSARSTCRACGSAGLTSVLNLGTQYLPRFTPTIDHSLPRAPLDLGRCPRCGLLQLRHSVNADLLYREFWYRSGINQTMRTALDDVVRDVARWQRRGTWVDIGANDGYLLGRVPKTFRRVACEPGRNFADDLARVADHVVLDYFGPEVAAFGPFSVVTSIAMFYDLDDPTGIARQIADALEPGGIWINQLNDSPTMLRSNAFDAICHEHLCYYDLETLRALYERVGLTIVGLSFNDVNAGSMRVTAMRATDATDHADLAGVPIATADDALGFAARVTKWRDVMGEIVSDVGPGLWCYGASTKGAVLLQYLNLPDQFFAVADRNPLKHGLRMSGSWLPIVGEAEFRRSRPRYALVLPWAFRDEFNRREAEIRSAGTSFIYPLPNIEVVL